MAESQNYANHYLKQLAASTGDNGHIEMSEATQSGGVGLGNANNITSRYLIPASINSKKSVVSVDVHGPGRNPDNSIPNRKVRRKRKKKNNSTNKSQRGGKRRAQKRKKKKKKKRSRVYKGGGNRPNKHSVKKKFGRFDNLRDNF